MATLEDLRPGAVVRGVIPTSPVTVVDTEWYGTTALTLVYRDAAGRVDQVLLYRDREPQLLLEEAGSAWNFNADGARLRLVSEARRIRLAHLFDPLVAVHSSRVEPLPHQITAVYEEMLPRQPLRFLLADDPGSGKTIMAGLLIKELLIRGDLQRCLVVCPGSLVEQWQDELSQRFNLPFEIMTNDKLVSARTGNWLAETPLAIARLDKLSRDEDVQARIRECDWDLIICDEAHKMSASFFGNEAQYTKRYHLGQLLSEHTRHFLLMSATPHNGKEADFQLFMALLDADRFAGKYRPDAHTNDDTSDLMRRLVKEQLLKFDGTPLFPERIAYTVNYALSDLEASLYEAVTAYVRNEFNRADALGNDGRRGTVGFALTTLQRRLASSPEAIFRSLQRRRERLEQRLREEHLLKRGSEVGLTLAAGLPTLTEDDLDDLEDAPGDELEAQEEQVVDLATAAQSIAELQLEIDILRDLELLANRVRQSGTDRKWEQLSSLLQDNPEMHDHAGHRRKLVIFTEHRDTLDYLVKRITSLLGRPDAVVTIHGGVGRDERRQAQNAFTQDPAVEVLVATDAAGEGINLQRAHLMVNYDLPWNPNRLEQRFGRIHRIGQTEVCHLWNLVASETREGDVYFQLLKKLEYEREALGGQVFDVLGRVTYGDKPLRTLLLEAIRYGDSEDVRQRLTQVVDSALDREHLRGLLEERALDYESMNTTKVQRIREDMERAEARRLQPHFIAAFFIEAFKLLGGTLRRRETDRYEITHVPSALRSGTRFLGASRPVLPRYDRITFERDLVAVPGKPLAEFISPGHPLLDAVLDTILQRYADLLKQGAILVDPTDMGTDVRALCYLEHVIQDGRLNQHGQRRDVSKQMQFVELDRHGHGHHAGYAPYLDYRPLEAEERAVLEPALEQHWLGGGIADQARGYAIANIVPAHVQEVQQRTESRVVKTQQAVHERLTREIQHWDFRAQQLLEAERAGKATRGGINSTRAMQRRDDLEARLRSRTLELEQERHLAPQRPEVVGAAIVVPAGLLASLVQPDAGVERHRFSVDPEARRHIERAAMDAVLMIEQALGYEPRDVSNEKRGYDIESRIPGTGRLRFIEVKGRISGAPTVTVTRNEILCARNKPDEFILALVEVDAQGNAHAPRYLQQPFQLDPGFEITSVNFNLPELLARAGAPA